MAFATGILRARCSRDNLKVRCCWAGERFGWFEKFPKVGPGGRQQNRGPLRRARNTRPLAGNHPLSMSPSVTYFFPCECYVVEIANSATAHPPIRFQPKRLRLDSNPIIINWSSREEGEAVQAGGVSRARSGVLCTNGMNMRQAHCGKREHGAHGAPMVQAFCAYRSSV